jgi:hypothetical protein
MTRPTFITLGPAGTCHENALQHYLRFQGVTPHEVVLVEDLLAAIGRGRRRLAGVREEPNTFLVQCSAHVQVHLVTERYHEEVSVEAGPAHSAWSSAMMWRSTRAWGSSRLRAGIWTSRALRRSSISHPSRSSRATCWRASSTRGSRTCTTPRNTPTSCGWWSTTGRSIRPGWSTGRASALQAP